MMQTLARRRTPRCRSLAAATLVASCWLWTRTAEAVDAEPRKTAPPSVVCHQPIHWRWAELQRAWNYVGYKVGGGAPTCAGCPPRRSQGTWGWDYSGSLFNRRVELNWWARSHYQGGSGQYEPDGPRPIHELHAKHE